ncbi:MAG: DUF5050 domain-containing protein, partial [Bacteroidota bacterium]
MKNNLLLFFVFLSLPFPNLAQNQLYWSTIEPGLVQRGALDGSNSSSIFADVIFEPISVTVDADNNHIYWGDRGSKAILRSNLDGSNITTITDGAFAARAITIDHTNNKIYYGDANVARLYRMDLDGSNRELIFSDNLGSAIYGIALDVDNNQMFFSTVNDIYTSDLDPNNATKIVTDMTQGRNLLLDQVNSKVYWTELGFASPGTINRCDLDGSNVESLINETIDEPSAFDIDFDNQKIYWIDEGLEQVLKANLDGSNIEMVLDLQTSAFVFIFNMELDLVNEKIYWTNSLEPSLRSVDLNGNNLETIIVDYIDDPAKVIVNSRDGMVYVGDKEIGIIRADLDGMNPEQIHEGSSMESFALTHEHLYYFLVSDDIIARSDLDGTNIETIVTDVTGFVRDIAIDTT